MAGRSEKEIKEKEWREKKIIMAEIGKGKRERMKAKKKKKGGRGR